MPTFIYLTNWTDQGIRNVKDTVGRAQAAKALAERMGGSFTYHWTLGQYDFVGVAELPDEESGVAFALAVGSQGNVRTTTLRAYATDEITGIIGKLE